MAYYYTRGGRWAENVIGYASPLVRFLSSSCILPSWSVGWSCVAKRKICALEIRNNNANQQNISIT